MRATYFVICFTLFSPCRRHGQADSGHAQRSVHTVIHTLKNIMLPQALASFDGMLGKPIASIAHGHQESSCR